MIKREFSYEKFYDLESKEQPYHAEIIDADNEKKYYVSYVDVVIRRRIGDEAYFAGWWLERKMTEKLREHLIDNDIEYFTTENEIMERERYVYYKNPREKDIWTYSCSNDSRYLDVELCQWRWARNNTLYDQELYRDHGFGIYHKGDVFSPDAEFQGDVIYYKARFWLLLNIKGWLNRVEKL